jgi:tetratricopeptide (TPR) repeat protein
MPVDDIQHAYLHFMLDPLVLKYRLELQKKNALLGIAATAPRLPLDYQNDFIAFADECLIKAVELRLRRLTPPALETVVSDYDQSGFILVRPFVQQLQKFEKSEPAMSYYFPDLIAGVDVSAEQKRLKGFTFAAATPTAAKPKEQSGSTDSQDANLERLLAEGDRQIALQQGAAAATVFGQVLEKYPNQPRAMYGLAIASVLVGKADQATELFQRLVSTGASSDPGQASQAPEPSIVAWSHVYLGRIHDLQGDRDLAVSEYRAALGVGGAPESARVAAQGGADAAYKPATRPPDSK